jgi:hypothetical protein
MCANYNARFNRKTAQRNSLNAWGTRIREVMCAWSRRTFVEENARYDLFIFLLTIVVFIFMIFGNIPDGYIHIFSTHKPHKINMYHSYNYWLTTLHITKRAKVVYNYHLSTEAEETVCFVKHRLSRVHKTHCFPEVSVNKCFIIYE